MNLLRGRLDDSGSRFLVAQSGAIRLPAGVPQFKGQELLLGVRPEHLFPASDGFSITVELVEVLGADMLIHGKAGSEAVIVRLPDGEHPAFGSAMPFGFSAAHVHWFDPATSKRVTP